MYLPALDIPFVPAPIETAETEPAGAVMLLAVVVIKPLVVRVVPSIPPLTVKIAPSKVKFASALCSWVTAVAVITLLFALFRIVFFVNTSPCAVTEPTAEIEPPNTALSSFNSYFCIINSILNSQVSMTCSEINTCSSNLNSPCFCICSV